MIELKSIYNQLLEDDTQAAPAADCYYPGGFKPPHEGHFEVLKDLLSRPYIKKVIILIGHKDRDGITKEMSKAIWDLYVKQDSLPNVKVRISDDASPIADLFSIFNNDLTYKAYVAGTGDDGGDQTYFNSLKKAFGERAMTLPVDEKVVSQGKRLSGTEVRGLITQLKSLVKQIILTDKDSTEHAKAKNQYLNTLETLKGCFPESIIQKGYFDDILHILNVSVLTPEQLQEVDPNTYRVPSTSAPIGKDDDVTKGQDTVVKIPYNKTTEFESFMNTNLIPFEYSQYNFKDGEERRVIIPNLGDNEDGQSQRKQVIDYLNKAGIPHNLEEYKLDVKPTVSAKDVDPKELKKGIKVEKEHTTDIKTATRIALDHLSEDPYYYTKLAKAKLEEEPFSINWWKDKLQEITDNSDIIQDFIDFCIKSLDLKEKPDIEFIDDENAAKQMHALGAFNPTTNKLIVVKGSRLTADILRTLAHELVHRKQAELDQLGPDSGKTGSPTENEANAAAGVLMRQYGKYKPEIFEASLKEAEQKKTLSNPIIYCDMDGVLVDFEKGYKDLTTEDASYKTDPNKFWAPITKAGASFWIKLEWMPDGHELWDYIEKYNPTLLSAPSREESSRIGKRIWVKRNLPGTKLLLKSAERKQEYAAPNAILIDDRKDNTDRWKEAGGIGIHHTSAAKTIEALEKLGL